MRAGARSWTLGLACALAVTPAAAGTGAADVLELSHGHGAARAGLARLEGPREPARARAFASRLRREARGIRLSVEGSAWPLVLRDEAASRLSRERAAERAVRRAVKAALETALHGDAARPVPGAPAPRLRAGWRGDGWRLVRTGDRTTLRLDLRATGSPVRLGLDRQLSGRFADRLGAGLSLDPFDQEVRATVTLGL